ncbi:unnamed protein product [Notodromas monacha]|uniref:DNA polymerase n=1 Tax=Notodromas monacha TaxID=399045 RepID=A0A7R9BM07_9CRUS|nr:unnamed protein product [Notodromas monacha]CAG0916476.1 unnamed protein product [Notodromas monacha]
MDDRESLAGGRERRTASRKVCDRLSALQRLKESRGKSLKDKYEIEEVDNVYDEVDENEYSERVRERSLRDFVIDDDGSGYFDDGREIFDGDSGEEDSDALSTRRKAAKDAGRKSSHEKESVKTGDIRKMLKIAPSKNKPKVSAADLSNDSDLLSIMAEMKCVTKAAPVKQTKPAKNPFVNKRPAVSEESLVRNVRPRITSEAPVSSSLFDALMEDDAAMQNEVSEESSLAISDFDSQTSTIAENGIESFSQDTEGIQVKMERDDPEAMEPLQKEVKSESRIKEENLGDQWERILAQQDSVKAEVDEKGEAGVQIKGFPLVKDASNNEYLKFFWLDAFEEMKQPGTVFLFGKVAVDAKTYVSCCISVRNLERQVLFLPREKHLKTGQEVTCKDVYEELQKIVLKKFGIMSFRVQEKDMNYAFERPDVPNSSKYLVVRYPAKFGELPPTLTGDTFSCVFAAKTSVLETFLIQQRLKGPCWLQIHNLKPSPVPYSWCKLEADVDSYKDVKMDVAEAAQEPPPIVMLCLSVQTFISPSLHKLEPVMIGMLTHTRYPLATSERKASFQDHCCLFTKPAACVWPYDHQKVFGKFTKTSLKKMNTVRDMLSCFLAKIQLLDPDVIIGYDLTGCTVDVLLDKLHEHKVPHWSRLGRLRRAHAPPKGGVFGHMERVFTGRVVCDVKISIKELIRCRSYDLPTVCSEVFPKMRPEDVPPSFSSEETVKFYDSSAKITELITWTMLEGGRVLDLCSELSILPLALQITKIAGNLLSRTLLGGRSERNEFLLLHAFAAKNFVVPDKHSGKDRKLIHDDDEDDGVAQKGKKRKPAYKGGLVLEPKKGLHDNYILLMDFKSLYPSIIQEYNICFTTVEKTPQAARGKTIEDEEEEWLPPVPEQGSKPGILPSEIRKLVETRQAVKKMLKEPNLSAELKQQYDVRQKAIKLMANSMYGCLGFSHSRFYAPVLARLITAKGREILEHTRDLVQNKMGLEVIYGDTDSIMINTNVRDLSQVSKMGNRIQVEVNKAYKLLELEVDNVFRAMLLLKKKKYAAVNVVVNPDGSTTETIELKGLDIVRRDWSTVACEAGRHVVNTLLSVDPLDEKLDKIATYLETVGNRVRDGKCELEELTIAKTLTRDPALYPDKNSQPHVAVAMRLNAEGGKKLKAGDTIKYVICLDGTTSSATQRAYALVEMQKDSKLQVDTDYYLSQQILPVVYRLCEPIEGIDAARIAECLGLDASKYHHMGASTAATEREDMMMSANRIDTDRFRHCERLELMCSKENCKAKLILNGLLTNGGDVASINQDPNLSFQLLRCSNENCDWKPFSEPEKVANALTKSTRRLISKYYQSALKCDDHACAEESRALPLRFSRGTPVCRSCNSGGLLREYSEAQLYNQLCFFQFMFHFEKATLGISAVAKGRLTRILAENRDLHASLNRLSNHMEKIIRSNSYSIVNLGELFASALPKKR